jgi:hypothetical protein
MREDLLRTASSRKRRSRPREAPGGGAETRAVFFRKAAFLAATAIGLTMHVATSARAQGRVAAAANAPPGLGVGTIALARGGALTVSPSEDAASVAVCAAPLRQKKEIADRVEVVERGGVESYAESDGVGVWCVALPPSELSFGLWLASHELAAAGAVEGEPPSHEPELRRAAEKEPGLARAAAIALEGATSTAESGKLPFAVSVAGHADAAAVEELARGYFGSATEAIARARPWQPSQTSERMSTMKGGVSSPTARYAWLTPRGSEDEAGIKVALEVLGGGERARLSRLLTDAHMARSVESWTLPLAGGTLSGLLVVPSSRVSIDRMRRFVDGALKQMRLVGPSKRELTRARQRLLVDAYRTWEDPVTRARLLASYELVRGGAERAPQDIAAVERITADTIRQSVRQGLRDARRTTIEIYPPAWPEDDPRIARQRLYTIAEGDTLAAIAARFGVEIAAITRINDLDPKYALSPGQPLWIPQAK